MDQKPQTRLQIVRGVLSVAGVFLLLHLAQRSDVLSELTRPLTVGILSLFGLPVVQAEDSLLVGRLVIPWSRDCAGLNVLAILWAMTIWCNRAEARTGRFVWRLVLAVPAAFAANVGRILTLIAYRQLLYPDVESPQLHYFFGFLWLMPVVWLFCPRAQRSGGRYVLETLHLAAALSLIAPLISAPGGSFVALSALLLLANSRLEMGMVRMGLWLIGWLVAALLIGVTRMESLWLPWLIACPAFTSFRASLTWRGCLLLPATIPLVALHTAAQWIVLLAAAAELRCWNQAHDPLDSGSLVANRQPGIVWIGMVALALLVPFAASPMNGLFTPRGAPPRAAMPRDLGGNAYRVHTVGQPPDLDMVWYEPSGEGRHHTLEVCMKYRGVTLKPGSIGEVKTDGRRWMREFFVQRGGLVLTYGEYLRRTSMPMSAAGGHLIASCPVETMSAAAFAESSVKSARELSRLLAQTQLSE